MLNLQSTLGFDDFLMDSLTNSQLSHRVCHSVHERQQKVHERQQKESQDVQVPAYPCHLLNQTAQFFLD